jgi:hypothetical protein
MDDPLKIYNDILKIAKEEFREEDHPRDEDGKFAKKDDAGDKEPKKTKMDDFLDYEEPENDYDELEEEELEIDYDDPKYTRAGLDDETLRNHDQNDKWQKWISDGGDQSVFDDPKELEDYEEWVTENPYRLSDLTHDERGQLELRKFRYWRDRQTLLGGKIETPLVKNSSNRWSVDRPKFFSSLKDYLKTDPDIMFEKQNSYDQQYLQKVGDDLNIGFTVSEEKKGEFINIAIDGFVPESEKDENGNNFIKMTGGNSWSSLYSFSKSRLDKFLEKSGIKFNSDKTKFEFKTFKLHAKDAHNLSALLPFFKSEMKRNEKIARVEKDNFDSIQNTKSELADVFPELTDDGADFEHNTYQEFKRGRHNNFEMSGKHRMWYGTKPDQYITLKIDKGFEEEPVVSIDRLGWDFERELKQDPEYKEKFRIMLNIFGGDPDDRNLYTHNEVTIPEIKEMREFYVDYNEKMAEIKRQQKELEEQRKNKRQELNSKYKTPLSQRDERYAKMKDELEQQLYEEPEIQEEPEIDYDEDDDDDFSEKDITIDYDPRKINLDEEPEYA